MRKLNKNIYNTYFIEKDSQAAAYGELFLFLLENEGVLVESVAPSLVDNGDGLTYAILFTVSE